MKKNLKIKEFFFLSILLIFAISCGNTETEKQNYEVNEQSLDKEEKWEEFTINAIGNTMKDMKYDITNISVSDGSWVRINLVNKGIDPAMLHNIVFVKFGSSKEVAMACLEAGPNTTPAYVANNVNIIAASDMADPQETVVLEFKAPKKGNYEYVCTYPGHSGIMKGYFFVK